MNVFAETVLSGSKIAWLGLYLLTCSVAIIFIAIFTIKVGYSTIKHRPYPKKYFAYAGAGIAVLILANLLINIA